MAKRKNKAIEINKISIVIPTYKRSKLAFSLAKEIRKQYPKVEIIIVEQEGKRSKLKEVNELEIKYFNLEKANTSVAKNFGWQKANGKVIVFLDDDVEITDGLLEAHVEKYQDKQVMGVAGRVINDDDNLGQNLAVETGKTNFLATKFVYKFWSTKKQEVDFVYGCNMSFRRKVLERVSGFDKRFPKIFEEVDLSKRVKKYGKLVFEPKALVYHHRAPSGGTRTAEIDKKKMIYRYYGLYVGKHLKLLGLITIVLRIKTIILKEKKRGLIKEWIKGYKQGLLNQI